LEGKTQEESRPSRFLLGELSEAEREPLEEAFFTDDDAFERMLAAEDELFDAYARGELSPAERARFEGRFLASPRGRERLRFARDLIDAATAARRAQPAPRPSFFAALRGRGAGPRLAFAAAALVAAACFAWLLSERARVGGELRQLRDERAALRGRVEELERRAAGEQARSAELLAQLEGERARPAPEVVRPEDDAARPEQPSPNKGGRQTPRPSVVAFVLTPGLVRGGGGRTLAVPRGASSVALRLNVEAGAFESYRAVIETAGGREVWRADALSPRGATVRLPPLPATALPPGDYVLLLSGKRPDGNYEGAADYSFRVVNK
jgi:hypothetical protein